MKINYDLTINLLPSRKILRYYNIDMNKNDNENKLILQKQKQLNRSLVFRHLNKNRNGKILPTPYIFMLFKSILKVKLC